MNNYKKYLEKAKKNKELPLDKEKKKKQDLLSMLKKYSEGSVDVQSNDEKAIEAGENARREAVNRTLASETKKEKQIDPNDYIQLNNLPIEHKYSMGIPSVPSPMGNPTANTTSSLSPLLKNTYGKMPGALAGFLHNKKMGNIQHFNDGGDVLSNLEQTFRKAFGYNEPTPTPHEETRDEKYARIRHQNLVNANEAPGQHNDVSDSKFSDGTPSVPDSIEDKAKKYGWSQDQVNYLKSLRHDIPQSPTPVQQPTQIPQGTEQGIHIDPIAAQNVAQAFAHGGMVKEHGELYKKFLNLYGGSPKVGSDKVPLSLPRAAHMTIPKRLHPVTDTKFYADGTPNVGMGDVQAADAQDRTLPVLQQGYGSKENDDIASSLQNSNRNIALKGGPAINVSNDDINRINQIKDMTLGTVGGLKNTSNDLEQLAMRWSKSYNIPLSDAQKVIETHTAYPSGKEGIEDKLSLKENGPKYKNDWKNFISNTASNQETVPSIEQLKGVDLGNGNTVSQIITGNNGDHYIRITGPYGQGYTTSLDEFMHKFSPSKLTNKYADGSPDVEESSPGVEVDDSDDAMVQKYRKLGLLKGPTVATSDQANVIGSIPKDEEDDTDEVAKDNGPYPGEEDEAQKVTDELPSEEIAKASDDKDVKDDEDLQAKKEVEEEDKKLAETEETPKDNLEAKYDKEEKDAEDNSDIENKERKIASEEDTPENIQQTKTDDGPMQRLKDAQDSQRNNILFNQLGKITDKMGASMGHFTPQNQDIYDENIKNADLPVKQLEQQIQMEKFDPNSNTSKAFRQYLTKFGGEDVAKLGNISAAQAEQIAPMAFKQFEAQQAQQAKAMELEERNKERLQQAQMFVDQKREASKDRLALLGAAKGQKADADKQRHDDKMEAKDIDRVDKLNKAINAEMSNGRSAFGIAAKNKQAVENAKALLNGEVDYNNLDNRQVVELARTLDRVLSGGNSTISGSEHLTPESARSWLSKKMEFITNKRQGAQAGSFIKTIAGTLDREGQQADKQILKAQSAFMGPYKSLAKNDKDSRSYQNYVNTLKSNNLNALLPKDEQEEVQPQPPQIPQAPTAQLAPNEVKRTTKDGRIAIFDGNTKKFLRYQ